MNRFVEVGQAMWQMLADTFQHVMRENRATYHADKAKVWAGFMSAASGAMARDLGADDAKTVLEGIIGAVDVVTAQETRPAPEPAPAGCEEWWHLKQYGYAPGGYTIRCFDCEEKVWDCDKRASICRPCAEKRHTANR